MGKSGNPAKRAEEEREQSEKNGSEQLVVSDVSAFKNRAKGTLVPLPSGMVAKLRRVDLQTMILSGNVHNPLMSVVGEALEKGKGADIGKLTGMDDGEIDLDAVKDMFEMVNHVIVNCFVEPKVHPMPEPDPEDLEDLDEEDEDYEEQVARLVAEEMDDDKLYVDEVDAEDKMFIFQWCIGGTDDVASFRAEARADMDAVAKGKGRKRKAKQSSGSRK